MQPKRDERFKCMSILQEHVTCIFVVGVYITKETITEIVYLYLEYAQKREMNMKLSTEG